LQPAVLTDSQRQQHPEQVQQRRQAQQHLDQQQRLNWRR
jgi:hypothetical protein